MMIPAIDSRSTRGSRRVSGLEQLVVLAITHRIHLTTATFTMLRIDDLPLRALPQRVVVVQKGAWYDRRAHHLSTRV
jgi:hypothetical protein